MPTENEMREKFFQPVSAPPPKRMTGLASTGGRSTFGPQKWTPQNQSERIDMPKFTTALKGKKGRARVARMKNKFLAERRKAADAVGLETMAQTGQTKRAQMNNQNQLENTSLMGRNQRDNTMLSGQNQLENISLMGRNQRDNTMLSGQNQLANTNLAGRFDLARSMLYPDKGSLTESQRAKLFTDTLDQYSLEKGVFDKDNKGKEFMGHDSWLRSKGILRDNAGRQPVDMTAIQAILNSGGTGRQQGGGASNNNLLQAIPGNAQPGAGGVVMQRSDGSYTNAGGGGAGMVRQQAGGGYTNGRGVTINPSAPWNKAVGEGGDLAYRANQEVQTAKNMKANVASAEQLQGVASSSDGVALPRELRPPGLEDEAISQVYSNMPQQPQPNPVVQGGGPPIPWKEKVMRGAGNQIVNAPGNLVRSLGTILSPVMPNSPNNPVNMVANYWNEYRAPAIAAQRAYAARMRNNQSK